MNLKRLGAAEVLDRALFASPGKPLGKERWAGAIDVVGSHTLANVCASMRYRGVVAACGLAGGLDFPATVAPFILRGVCLLGIDSVMCPIELRKIAWSRLAGDLDRLPDATGRGEAELARSRFRSYVMGWDRPRSVAKQLALPFRRRRHWS